MITEVETNGVGAPDPHNVASTPGAPYAPALWRT
jgi:hypothetical protein